MLPYARGASIGGVGYWLGRMSRLTALSRVGKIRVAATVTATLAFLANVTSSGPRIWENQGAVHCVLPPLFHP